MAKKNRKSPRRGSTPIQRGKKPAGGLAAGDVPRQNFKWRIESADMDGPWGWGGVGVRTLLVEIIPKLHSFESMTWAAVEGATGSHFVLVSDCIKDAKDRLKDIGQEDIADLFSLRLSGKKRIWGIRDVAILRILWWDPAHQVCPSLKKGR